MKKNFILLLLAAILTAGCSQVVNTEPTPTVSTSQTDASSSPPGDPLEYIDEFYGFGTYCADAIQKVFTLIDQAEGDKNIMDDETWKQEKNDVLKVMGDTCLSLGWDSGVPTGYEQANAHLLETKPYFSDFIEQFWEGASARDLEKMKLARKNLEKASELFAAASAALPE